MTHRPCDCRRRCLDHRARAGSTVALVALALVALFGLAAPAPADPPDNRMRGAAESRIDLRRAERPTERERRRVGHWHTRWRRQAEPLDRLLGGLGTIDQPPPVGRPSWCRALAEALVEFDRGRAFPVPSYAAGRSLRRGLDLLGQGAAACLEGRVYAASDLVRRAQRSFGDAAVVLRPYGVAP